MNPQLESLASAKLEALLQSHPLKRKPILEWRNLRVSAGIAIFRGPTIRLSRILLNTPNRVEETLIHEYAHLLAFERYGRAGIGHGPGWQSTMRDLGANPTIHHSFECQRNRPRQKLQYRCVRCGETFERSRRLPRSKHYVHRTCGGDLELESVIVTTDPPQSA